MASHFRGTIQPFLSSATSAAVRTPGSYLSTHKPLQGLQLACRALSDEALAPDRLPRSRGASMPS